MAPNFAWTDPNDHRDPEQMLMAEGVSFTDGKADPLKRMTSDDLTTLVADQR